MKNDPIHPSNWKYTSPHSKGFHTLFSGEGAICRSLNVFRLNLAQGDRYLLHHQDLEWQVLVIAGEARITLRERHYELGRLDAFYQTPNEQIEIEAQSDLILYLGGARYEGIGNFFIRRLDLSLPLGAIHQIHGKGSYQREVFMTLDPDTPASRLICGITWGQEGQWTSWPQHQHSQHLEEAYFFFDLPKPKFALQPLSRFPGEVEFTHTVRSGDCIAIPEGYHPTVSMPGAQSTYFWIMAAHSQASRRYDLAIEDPFFAEKKEL